MFLTRPALAGFFIAFILSLPVKAEEKAEYCGPNPIRYKDHVHGILEAGNPGLKWMDLGEDARKVFMAAFNASPPKSNHEADNVRLYTKPHARKTFLLISKGKCTVEAAEVPNPVIMGWLQGKPMSGNINFRQASF